MNKENTREYEYGEKSGVQKHFTFNRKKLMF